ncbi:class I SAM-dependent methyltransferase [Pontiellaceae bacterium B12219]|nr:class I SAM-dependent methyltransferase [Pontiellaceae bacterium B12219]
MKKCILNVLFKISSALRKKRIAKLIQCFKITKNTTILDVGGSGDWDWKSFGVFASVTSINLDPPPRNSNGRYIQGDACDMHMFKDDEFDLVFSNSVIEHLLSCKDQQRMASEIRRVGKSYWIQTPNRHFPLELHLCFPLVQYWPVKWRIAFARIWPFSFEKMRGRTDGAIADAKAILLTKADLQSLFPGAEIICERFMGVTKSLIAFKEQG